MKTRKDFTAQSLYNRIRTIFDNSDYLKQLLKERKGRIISITDGLMSALAMFSLKFPSMLGFNDQCKSEKLQANLKNLFGIKNVPSDTYMREIVDEIDPREINKCFKELFRIVQRGKILERFEYLNGHYILSVDGTGYFNSDKVHCSSCCEKHHRSGRISYYHQIVSAVMVHPEEKVVLPFAPVAIKQEDGTKKNDCEINGSKRLLKRIRKEHPHLKCIVVADGLYSNGPQIDMLRENKYSYILGAKPSNHKWLFDWVNNSEEGVKEVNYVEKGRQIKIRYINKVPLNEKRSEIEINFLECIEEHKGKKTRYSWITDIEITEKNVRKIMKGGSSRWKIENETFNTLKNQGYEFEHNYGHGNKNLSTVFANLMMLAFSIDQLQLGVSKEFKLALAAEKNTKCRLWEAIRSGILWLVFDSWHELFEGIIQRAARVHFDTS